MTRRISNVTTEQLNSINNAIFGYYDTDNNGYLDPDEVKSFVKDLADNCGKSPEESACFYKQFFKFVDENGDGRISKEEINMIMRKIIEQKICQK
jgi:Ca2+-binding EF-hand superfamily protein